MKRERVKKKAKAPNLSLKQIAPHDLLKCLEAAPMIYSSLAWNEISSLWLEQPWNPIRN